jgi:hypothetical protein
MLHHASASESVPKSGYPVVDVDIDCGAHVERSHDKIRTRLEQELALSASSVATFNAGSIDLRSSAAPLQYSRIAQGAALATSEMKYITWPIDHQLLLCARIVQAVYLRLLDYEVNSR